MSTLKAPPLRQSRCMALRTPGLPLYTTFCTCGAHLANSEDLPRSAAQTNTHTHAGLHTGHEAAKKGAQRNERRLSGEQRPRREGKGVGHQLGSVELGTMTRNGPWLFLCSIR